MGLFGITSILAAISSLILLPIMTKNFSISDYGIWVQINAMISLLPNIVTLGLPFTMVRFLSAEKDTDKIKDGFYSIVIIVLISTTIASSLLFLFSKSIASAIFNGDVNVVMLLSIIVFLASLNSLLISYFRTFQQMKRYSIFLLTQTYLTVLIVSYFAIKGFNINITSTGILIANLVIFFMMICFIFSDIGFKIPQFKNLREYLSFGIPTIPGNLSYWIVDSSDRFVIGLFLGTAFVGYYSPGYTLGNIIIMILTPFSFLLPSVLPKYYDENNIEKVRVYLKYSLKYFLLIAIPSAFGLSLLSKPILLILTTPGIALNGYIITPFVALSAILFGIYGIIGNILALEKKTKIAGAIWIIAAIMNLGLNIFLVPYLGIIGAAATTLLAYSIAFVLTLFYSTKFFKFDFGIVFIVKSIVASIIMSSIIFLIKPVGVFTILIVILISLIVYIVLILVMKGIEKEEFIFLRELLLNN
jgi:O-antigen/teichoic acid export membrane protein